MKLNQEGTEQWDYLTIKDCPRCGSEAEVFSLGIYETEMVKCSVCPVTVVHDEYNLEQLIEIWNELG